METSSGQTTAAIEITSAERAFDVLKGELSHDAEEFWVMALGPKKTLLAHRMIFRGTVDSCLVHPRDIFRFACHANASSLLVAHNHPSGDLIPSMEDLRFTRQLVQAAQMMEIPIVDHLILTVSGYASLRSDGWCRFDGSGFQRAAPGLRPSSEGGRAAPGATPGGARRTVMRPSAATDTL